MGDLGKGGLTQSGLLSLRFSIQNKSPPATDGNGSRHPVSRSSIMSRLAALLAARDRAEQRVRERERLLDAYQAIADRSSERNARTLATYRAELKIARDTLARLDKQIDFVERQVEEFRD
jgi:hypothetical protein